MEIVSVRLERGDEMIAPGMSEDIAKKMAGGVWVFKPYFVWESLGPPP